MKILCACEGGNVRSVACAYVLKYELGHDALAASLAKNSADTLAELYRWADHVIVMESWMEWRLMQLVGPAVGWTGPVKPLHVYDVGPDRWGSGLHPELLKMVRDAIRHDRGF